MNIKKKLIPTIITAILSVFMCIFTFMNVFFPNNIKPSDLMIKLGVFTDGAKGGILNNDFYANGTHEAYISLLKKTAEDNKFTLDTSFVFLTILIVVALIIISYIASNSTYKSTIYASAVLLPLVFCDFTNIVFFKTLFINPLVLTLLLLICAVFLCLYKKQSVGIAGIIIIMCLTIMYSRLNVIAALTSIVIGLLIARLGTFSKNRVTKIIALIMGCIVVIHSFVFVSTYKPTDYNRNLYNAVFFGVAQYDNVEKLGLDPKLNELAKKDPQERYYSEANEQEYDLQNTLYNKISYTDITKYYITHPINAYKVINQQSYSSFSHYYDFGFTPYNYIKVRIPMNFIIAIIVTFAFILIANVLRKKYATIKGVTEFFAGLAIMWLISLITGALYFGNSDVPMNMSIYSVLFDILLLIALIGGTRVVMHRQDEKKAEFGITHE